MDGHDAPSDEELRAYLAQLREAPVTDLLAQAVAMLVNAAQVKLGLTDGRTLIDVTTAVIEAAGDRVEPEFAQEVASVLDQLRLAQVDAEQQLAGGDAAADGSATAAPTGPETPPAPPAQAPPGSGPPGGSRLWTPGS